MQMSTVMSGSGRSSDRLHPRRRCHLRLDRPVLDMAAVKDIGLGGMRLLESGLLLGDIEEGRLHIPGSQSPCDVRYEVVHIGDDGAVGARFDGLTAGTRLRLTEYVDHVRSVELLKRLQGRLGATELPNLKPLGDPDATRRLIERLAGDRAELRVWADPRQPAFDARLVAARDGHLTLAMSADTGLAAFDEVMFAVDEGELVYMADTTVAHSAQRGAVIVMPDRLYRPERRRDLRDDPTGEVVGDLHARLGGQSWRLSVLEESGGGLSVIAPRRLADGLVLGERWQGEVVRRSGGSSQVEAAVAHVGPWWGYPATEAGFRVGLQRRVDRVDVPVTPLDFSEAVQAKERQGGRRGLGAKVRRATEVAVAAARPAPASPEVVRLDNRHGETVVALALRSTAGQADAIEALVVIPPAYGRKKEDTSGLALTIVESFRKAGAPVTVVRYDATHAVGESERPGRFDGEAEYHNAGYTLTRGASDLEDVIESFRPGLQGGDGPVGLVSFSLSAAVARRVVADDEGRRVRSWVAPCGAADTRDLVRNSTGGVDYLEDNRRGAVHGLRQVVGHVMDVESFCADAWQGRMADLPDARADMSRIGIPVTWICGDFDYWVNVHRVADMLTVRGPADAAPRELVTVPTGHIVRNSVEAVETFKIIAARLGRDLLGREIEPTAPSTREMLGLSRQERNRLRAPEFEPRAYWKRYLMGDGSNPLGFDVITLTAEYRDLLNRQIQALAVTPGDRVVDLGAGTGNMAEALVESMPPALSSGRISELNLVELVPEALQTARAKLERLQSCARTHRSTVWCHTYDLAAVRPEAGAGLPFGDASVDRVVASLLLSYLPDPVALLKDARRLLRPGGRMVISSFLPDTDLSGPLKRLLGRISHATAAGETVGPWRSDDVLDAVRSYVNDAAKLLDLACDGVFRFYDAPALTDLLAAAGFRNIRTTAAFGDPGQAIIASGERPRT